MIKLLLILTVSFSLVQVASAERWRGLIASVIALEAAKSVNMESVDVESINAEEPVVTKKPVVIEKPICKNGTCNTKRAPVTKKQFPRMQWFRRLVGKD